MRPSLALGGLAASLALLAAVPDSPASTTGVTDAARSPACQSADLTRSQSLAGGRVTVSPEPGSLVASTDTQISFLGPPASDLSDITVTGSRSGVHDGRLESYVSEPGASYLLAHPLDPGERVTVHARLAGRGGGSTSLDWSFTTAVPDVAPPPSGRHVPAGVKAPPEEHFVSRPALNPPTVIVDGHSAGLAPGYLFIAPESGPSEAGPEIFDDNGQVVWFDPLPRRADRAADFEVQTYKGQPALTFFEDLDTGHGKEPQDVILNDHYHQVADVTAGNGLPTDVHEFVLDPDGSALLSSYAPIMCDTAAQGGSADGAVTDGVFQRIDIPTGLVMYEWRALDHVPLADSDSPAHGTSPARPWDAFHLNSITTTTSGSLMVSMRNQSTIYGIDPASGQVRWRLGGRQSSFALGPGTATAFQHDARELPVLDPGEGTIRISVFDNGGVPFVHPQSRGVVIRLDFADHQATLLRQLVHSPPIHAGSQGDVQLLPDGHWLVGWGEDPWVTEYTASGTAIFDAHLGAPEQNYRAFRFPWVGLPLTSPVAVISRGAVYVSWNGATQVASWRLLQGGSADTLVPVATVPRSGFETRLPLPHTGEVTAVEALDATGAVIGRAPAHST